jgi:predicted phosphodiesterase
MAKGRSELHAAHNLELKVSDLQRELIEAKAEAVTASALRELIGTAKQNVEVLQVPDWTLKPKTAGAPGVPTVQLSDFHWGENVRPEQIGFVNEFNIHIARHRLRRVIEGAIKLARILDPGMRYPGICMPLVGDMVSGNIHEELAATNDINTMPTVLDLYKHLVPAIKLMADTFGNVFLPCVSGNHDRDTKKTWNKDRNHTSFGWLLYNFLALRFEDDPRITFYIPDGPDALYKLYNTRYLATHGDQFKGGDGIIGPLGPITRGEQKKNARNSAVGQDFDVMVFGHFHQRLLSARLRGNSSLKGYDEYANANNFKFEPPSQNFFMTHPDMGITFDAPLFADKIEMPKAAWVSLPKQK